MLSLQVVAVKKGLVPPFLEAVAGSLERSNPLLKLGVTEAGARTAAGGSFLFGVARQAVGCDEGSGLAAAAAGSGEGSVPAAADVAFAVSYEPPQCKGGRTMQPGDIKMGSAIAYVK